MTLRIFLIGLLAPLLPLLQGCKGENAWDCLQSTGDVIKQERGIIGFKAVNLSDEMELVIVQDLPDKIIIEAGENLLSDISTVIRDTTLYVRNNNTCNWVRSYKKPMRIYVGVNQCQNFFSTGWGNIRSEGVIQGDKLFTEFKCQNVVDLQLDFNDYRFIVGQSCLLKLSGTANYMSAYMNQYSSVQCQALACPHIYMNYSSENNSYVRCDDILSGEIFSSGNIYYAGTGNQIVFTEHSSGKAIAQ